MVHIFSYVIGKQSKCYVKFTSLFYNNKYFSKQSQAFIYEECYESFILYFRLLSQPQIGFSVYTSLSKDNSISFCNWSILPGPFQCMSRLWKCLITDHKLKDRLTIIYMSAWWYSSLRWQEENPWGAQGGKITPVQFLLLVLVKLQSERAALSIKSYLWCDFRPQFPGGCCWLSPWSGCVWVWKARRPLCLSALMEHCREGALASQFLHCSLTVLLFDDRRNSHRHVDAGVLQPAITHLIWPFQSGCHRQKSVPFRWIPKISIS